MPSRLTAEVIIRDRIKELQQLEAAEHLARLRTSYQERRNELETLLIRLHALDAQAPNGA